MQNHSQKLRLLSALCLAGFLIAPLSAQTLFWDTSDDTGLQAGDGNWSTETVNWNEDADGEDSRVVWANGADAVFNAAGTSNVAAQGTTNTQVSNITFQSGIVSVSGSLRLNAGGSITMEAGAGASGFTDTGNSDGVRPAGASTYTNNNISDNLTIGRIQRLSAGQNINLSFAGAGDTVVSVLANSGTGSVTKDGAGTLTINSRSNQNNQTFIVNGGVLNLGLSDNVTTATNATALTLNGGALRTNHDRTTGISNAAHGITLGASGGTLEQTGSTTFTQAGVISGGGDLTKTGTGTLHLSGDAVHTYTGATHVNNGILLVDATLDGSGGALTIGGNGTLGGTGIINRDIHFDAGAKLIFDPDATLNVDGGTVSFDGFGFSDLVGFDAFDGLGTFTLFGGDFTLNTANISNFGAGDPLDLGDGRSAYFKEGSLQVVVIPEPGTLMLLGIALGALLLFRRRR
ncbi:MAG: autotransporter-associated beta strand repeat-containing protein [Verrucomicrobia bacterium]|nr:autotransporter-associated beta strand repeat-containing protein [Verrucomicrobiota bacterium]MCH8513917.1 autotransporter-associated beta strand repeat-containing protein [Kiritimatiellia bacterium]